MLAKLLERLYPPLPAQPKDPVDRTRVVVVGVPSVWEELPTSDLRTLWFLSYISVQKGITCEGIVASSPRLAPSKQLPYVSTTGVYDGEVFDSLLSWLQAHPGSEHATLSPEAFAIHSAIERTLYEPFYRWLCTQRTELAVQIYGRPQDPFVWLRRMHFRFVDYPQHFKAKKINLKAAKRLLEELEKRLGANEGHLVREGDFDGLLDHMLSSFVVVASRTGFPVALSAALLRFANDVRGKY